MSQESKRNKWKYSINGKTVENEDRGEIKRRKGMKACSFYAQRREDMYENYKKKGFEQIKSILA